MTTTLSLGFSPCPNDCFIFDALIHHKIDTEGLEFECVMEDVERLNRRAFSILTPDTHQSLAITKLSFHSYAYLTKPYQLLDAGSALGNNCGPLLIAKNPIPFNKVPDLKIAIPGKYTTANFLFSLAFPHAKDKIEMVFSAIEQAVLDEKVQAGLIIHENRFTFEQKGLTKIIDLGEYWESLTQMPIPLGGIVIDRRLPKSTIEKVNRLIRKSVEFAFAHPESSKDFVAMHAQEMSEEVRNKHIDLYVNQYSIDLGEKGRNAVELLFAKALELKLIDAIHPQIFIA